MVGSPCIECYSTDTHLFRGEDDHFRKKCESCGHVGGPYVSEQTSSEGGQASLGDFA